MGIGIAAIRNELCTQIKRLMALTSQISPENLSDQYLLYTAPEQLKEIEEEVRSIANRCHIPVFANKLDEPVNNLWEICESIEASLQNMYVSLSERIQINAQFLAIYSKEAEKLSAHLREQIHAIRAIYASHRNFRCLRESPKLINNLEQAEKLLNLKSHPLQVAVPTRVNSF